VGSLFTCAILEGTTAAFGTIGLEGGYDGLMGQGMIDTMGFGVLSYFHTSFWGWTWRFSLVNLINQRLLYENFRPSLPSSISYHNTSACIVTKLGEAVVHNSHTCLV
jgi:hypothetical protein